MTKYPLTIPVDEPSSSLYEKVCVHLLPVFNFLEDNGCIPDYSTGKISDVGDGNFYLFNSINFDLLNNCAVFPNFIKINLINRSIFCEKCWSTIMEKKESLVFNAPQKIIY